MRSSLAKRSIESVGWNAAVNVVVVLISLVRSIFLARWLPVEVFGIYAGADALIGLTAILSHFGMGAAFIHRAPETEDEDKAARVLLSLKIIFTAVWVTVVAAGALMFTADLQRTTIITLLVVRGLAGLAAISSVILVRRVVHRRIALIQLADALLKSVVALLLAWAGWGIWALIATDIVSLLVYVAGMYLWRPVWRFRIAWDPAVVRYYFHYGSRNFLASALVPALDRLDDLWSAVYLGATATGYYSRAYAFATYPRAIVAKPVNLVAGGTFAELKRDRLRLSKAFFRTNALLVRTGFIFAGILVLIAPELIRLLLGEKWLPMVSTFRLMLLFALLDPLKQNIASLFLAVGEPGTVLRVRLVQLGVLIAGLYTLGNAWGIAGIAVAVDIMLAVGIGLFFHRAKRYADFSLITLFLAPLLALAAGMFTAYALTSRITVDSDIITAAMKAVVFGAIYSAVLFFFERHKSWEMFTNLRRLW